MVTMRIIKSISNILIEGSIKFSKLNLILNQGSDLNLRTSERSSRISLFLVLKIISLVLLVNQMEQYSYFYNVGENALKLQFLKIK